MPLANYIILKKYRLNDIIVKKGDIPKNLYIISKGRGRII